MKIVPNERVPAPAALKRVREETARMRETATDARGEGDGGPKA